MTSRPPAPTKARTRPSSATSPPVARPACWVAAALGLAGRREDARSAIARLAELDPELTVETFLPRSMLRHSGKHDLILEGLRIAGLRER